MNNPILNEIREMRNEHAKQFNYDVEALSLDYDKKHDEIMQLFEKTKNDYNKINAIEHFSLPLKNVSCN